MLNLIKAKKFAIKFNEHLDNLGMPEEPRQRSIILSKLLHLSRQTSRMILEGYKMPDPHTMQQLKKELDWDLSSQY